VLQVVKVGCAGRSRHLLRRHQCPVRRTVHQTAVLGVLIQERRNHTDCSGRTQDKSGDGAQAPTVANKLLEGRVCASERRGVVFPMFFFSAMPRLGDAYDGGMRMTYSDTRSRNLSGQCIIKTAGGIIRCAAIVGAGTLFPPVTASAQAADPLDCLPNSSGPTPGDPTPFGGGMCNLGASQSESSRALGVSDDGTIAIGTIGPSGDRAAFTWTSADGVSLLDGLSNVNPTFAGTSITSARAVTVDASGTVFIAGQSRNDLGRARPVRWTDGAIEDLGTLLHLPQETGAPNPSQGNAQGINADGSVVVGWSFHESVSNERRAYRWVEGGNFGGANPQMQNLGLFAFPGINSASEARDVSASGDVVVGIVGVSGVSRAFRWVEGGTDGFVGNPEMQDLGSLRIDNGGLAEASAVNTDGTVVVGTAENDSGQFLAYRWIEDSANGPAFNPEMQSLGTLTSDGSGFSQSFDVNDDGTVVVGYGTTDSGDEQAFRWVEDGDAGVAANPEMQVLGSLRSDGTGFSLARAVNADGSVVVGEAETDDDTFRAFIWRTQMQDFENLMLSYAVTANDTEIAVAQQQAVVGRLMDETCLAEDDQSCLRVGGWLANTGSTASQDIGRRTSGVATLTYGSGLDGQTTLGGTLSVSGSNLSSNGFDMGSGVGFSLWSEYSEGGLARTGWQAGASIGWGRESGAIARGRGLDNVMLATGDASLDTFGARAAIGYGFQQQEWLIIPSATLAHFRTSRSAYAETGADFNASYDALSIQRTTATLAISAERSVAEQGILSLGVGVERDLSVERAILTGTSTIPGMESFAVGSTLERHRTRGFLDAGYTHDLGDDRAMSGSLRVGQAAFGSAPQVSLGVHYGVRF